MINRKSIFFSIVIFSFLLTACGFSRSAASVSNRLGPNGLFADFELSRPDAVRDRPVEPMSGKTAFDYLRDERIYSGWNLGNTLDSFSSGGFAGETNWGNPLVNQELMNGVKAAGFDIIRIPITWMGFFGRAPDYNVQTSRLNRVAEVVDMARNAGLKVIINMHHDGQTTSPTREDGWFSISRASRNQEDYNAITHQYVRLWMQIATYFKNYGDWLIFEGFNELHDGNWQQTSDVRHFMTLSYWNQIFVDTVRASGGNNASRFLIVSGYCKCPKLTLSGFLIPTDTAENKLIISFHYYDPYQFGIEGSRSAWGTEADRQIVINDFAPFKERYIDQNIPVLIGECGAVRQLYPDDPAREAQARQSRLEYLRHIFSTAKRFGLVPIYWDNGLTTGRGEKFGLLDRRTGRPNSPESEALLRAMINSVR